MKKLVLALTVAALFAVPSFAQDKEKQDKDKEKSHMEWEKKLKAELKLDDGQTAKFDAISKEYKDKMDAMMKDPSLAPDLQKDMMMKMKEEKHARITEILTPEQSARFKELMEEKKKKMREKEKDKEEGKS